jgi:hypothetical protein
LGRSTFDLIHQAVDQGQLTLIQALLYEARATFGGASVPSQYRGDPRAQLDSPFFADVTSMWSALSPADQTDLLPWMLPGYVSGSWWDVFKGHRTSRQPARLFATGSATGPSPFDEIAPFCSKATISPDWSSQASPKGLVRVWWPTGPIVLAAYASQIALQADEAWAKVKSLTGRQPLPDSGDACAGGDPSYDIVIDPVKPPTAGALTQGATQNRQGTCPSAAYTTVYPGLKSAEIPAVIVHELTHAVQIGTERGSCNTPGWFAEGMAVWAEEAAYPSLHTAHQFGSELLDSLSLALESRSRELRDYGMWLVFYDLVVRSGAPDLVTTILNRLSTGMSALAATDVGGDLLADAWRQFTLDAWNQDEHNQWSSKSPWPSYTLGAWTSSPNGAGLPDNTDNKGKVKGHRVMVGTYTMAGTLEPLSARYYRYNLRNSTADHVHWISFQNPYFGDLGLPTGGVAVRALVHRGGKWTTEDWTPKTHVDLCLDKLAQKLDELVIIFSNSAPDTVQPQGTPQLIAKASCPKVVGSWVGRVTQTLHTRSASGDATPVGFWPDDLTYSTTASEVRFYPSQGPQQDFIEFQTTEGAVTEEVSGTIANCTMQGGGSIVTARGSITLEPRNPDTGRPDPGYEAAGVAPLDNQAVKGTVKCPDPNPNGPQSAPFTIDMNAWLGTAGRHPLPTQTLNGTTVVMPGATISGSGTYSSPDGTTTETYSWSFRYEADDPLVLESCSTGATGPTPSPSANVTTPSPVTTPSSGGSC